MSKPTALGFWVLGLACLTGVSARAQTRAGDPVRFSLGAGMEWTDNRDSTSQEESDTLFYMAPRLDLVLSTSRLVLDFYYAPFLQFRTHPSDWQNEYDWLNDLGLDLTWTVVQRLRLMLLEEFRTAYDPEIKDNGVMVRRDSSYLRNRVEAGAGVQVSRNVNLDLRGRHICKLYSENLVADQSDETTIGCTATAWWQLLRTFGLLAAVDATAMERAKGTYDVDRDFDAVAAMLGVEKVFSQNLRLAGRVGYKTLSYSDNALDDDSAPFMRLILEGAVLPSFRIIGNASYELRSADDYPFTSQQYTGLGGRIELDTPGNRLTFGLGGDYRLGHYKADTVPRGYDAQEANDTTWQQFVAQEGINVRNDGDKTVIICSADVTFRFNNQNKLKFVQRYEDVNSDVSEDFTRNSSNLSYTRDF
jgi:hypothetical protein